MRNVYDYILEAKETSSNKERLEQLRKWLKGKNYEEYVDALNKMLEDPKAKTLLDEGFGTEFGDLKFKYRAKLIAADELYPSQNEIDIDKTIGAPFKNPDNINKQYVNPIVIANMPLVTFNGKYIIDAKFEKIEQNLEQRINNINGVLENGLFINYKNIQIMTA